MILKQADDRTMDLAILKSLSARKDASPDVRKRIEQEIRNLQAGIRGEKEAAYEIEFHYGASKNWMILHDLRLEHGGRVAQIDHLLLNRFLEVYLCETKNYSEGIAVNEHGEFTAWYNGKPYGIPSPVEQNRRHAAVLDALFRSGTVALPTRLGFPMTPAIIPLVLVSAKARISRPKKEVEGLDSLIKMDRLLARIEKEFDAEANPLVMAKMAKLVSPETLEVFARRLVAAHRPVPRNWAARFGLPEGAPPPTVPAPRPVPPFPSSAPGAPSTPTAVPSVPPSASAPSGEEAKEKSKLACSSCGVAVTYAVARFCWFNRPRFGGKVYCMECQKKVPKPA